MSEVKQNNGWISVKKRKPKQCKLVLLSNADDKWVVVGERIGKNYWNQFEYDGETDLAIYPTHWQPLPPAPKQD